MNLSYDTTVVLFQLCLTHSLLDREMYCLSCLFFFVPLSLYFCFFHPESGRWISGVVETRCRIVNDDVGDRLEVIVDSTSVRDSVLGKVSPRLEGWQVPVDQLSER